MSTKRLRFNFHRTFSTPLRLMMVLFFVFSALSLQPPQPVEAAPFWIAYNDTNTTAGSAPTANVTTYTIPTAGTATGLLRNYSTGANLGVTVTITTNLDPELDQNGVTPNAGTDAYNTFNGIVDLAGGIWYGESGWWVDVTFTGLDPANTYTFATTNNRNNDLYTDRYTKFTIRDITAATNASSSGAAISTTTLANDTVSFWSYNTVNGYVARWIGIQPGPDGDFNIRYESNFTNGEYRAYGPSGFMLQQDSTDPTILAAGSLAAFSAIPGTPSAPQSYTVSGINLTAPIVITPPADFEISLSSGSGFSSTPISLTPSSGSVATTPIYVRFTRATAGSSSGNITHTSSGATPVNTAVSGTASLCTTVQLTATEDTYVSAANVTYNNGGFGEIHVNNTAGTARRAALLRWDLSSIPANATVSAASLRLNVIDASPLAFNLYNMRRTWVEGTSSQAVSNTSANWNTYNGVNSWGTVGIASTTLDRYSTNLWGATTTSFETTGSKTEALNSSGIAVVQGWIDGSLTNYGLTMQNYAGTTDNAVYFSSSEVTAAANRPALNVSYCVPDPRPTNTVTFQYGAAGYTGTVDTYIRGTDDGNSNYSASTDLQWDENTGTTTDEITLIRFEDLFVSEGGSIPDGAIISSANLTYTVTDLNSGSTAEGDPANVYESLVNWPVATVTYNNFGGEAGVQADEYRATPVVSAPATARSTPFTIDVTASIQRWSNNPAENFGWIFLPTNQDGVNIYSSEFATLASRPRLSVTYVLPSTCYALSLSHSGNGTTPTATPANSAGCTAGTYLAGANISLSGAVPDSGWSISGWTGTSNDSSLASTNTVVMPAANHAASVIYTMIPPTCYALTVSHTGNGSNPSASPANSSGCTAGSYIAGESIALSGAVPASGWAISGWTGTINNASTAATNSVLMPAAAHAASVIYADINDAPNIPTLVQPADNATGISTSPTLQVTVTDPDSNPMNVSFYGRAVEAEVEDFMIALLPDIQNETQYAPAMFTSQVNWLVANKDTNNIAFVIGLGDVVNNANSTTEYTAADAGVDILDAGGVWYTIAPGNHDYPGYSTPLRYGDYFGLSRYAGHLYSNGGWFGGSYDTYNTYSLFSAGGMDFILISLQFQPTTAILNWADALLTTYSDRRAIVEEHDLLNTNNSWVNQAAYNALRDHDNLFLMVCGHMHTASDGAAYVAGTGTGGAGQTIHVVMADYQEMSNGNGWLRLLRFAPADDTIYMTTYSPYTGGSITTNPDQMNLAYDMDAAGPFTLIGTANGVASGANASVPWNGLTQNTEYEWYAVANDGALSTTSPTWSFTTGTSGNVAPVITEGASTTVTMSEDATPTPFTLTLNATDGNPGDTLTWSIATVASHGTAAASGTGTSVAVGYTPNLNYAGSDSFVVQVSDGFGGVDSITVTVNISAVNDPPVAMDDAFSTPEDTALVRTSAQLVANDTDVDGPALSVSAVSNPTNGTVSLAGSTITFTPTANFSGTAGFDYTVTDGEYSDTGHVTVNVTAVNDPPVAVDDTASTAEDTAVDILAATLLVNDTDADGPALSVSAVNNPTNGTVSLAGSTITFTPTANFSGTAGFDYTVTDGEFSDTGHVTVNVTAVNDPPVAVDDAFSTPEDTALVRTSAQLVANDTDVDGPALSVSAVNNPTNGTVSLAGSTITFTPTANFSGTAGFDYTVTDGEFSDTGHVTVTVTAVNDPPELDPVADASLNEMAPFTFTATAEDDDSADTLTFSLVGAPTGAAIDPLSGVFTWTPTEAQGPQVYTFTVQVCDNGDPILCDTDEVTLTVAEVNIGPAINQSDPVSVLMSVNGLPNAFSLTLNATDPDLPANTLTWSILTPASHGTASVSDPATGTAMAIGYTPALDYVGSDSFVVQVLDGNGGNDSITVNVTIAEVTYTISGSVGLPGVSLAYTGGTPVTSGAGGAYSITVPYGWTGTVTPSLTGYTFTPLSRDYTDLQADQVNQDYTFSQNEYTLTVNSAHGTVTINPSQLTYHYGDQVTLTAAASPGWTFTTWSGDATGSDNPITFTITGNMVVTANYSQNEYTLTVISEHGTVTINPQQSTYHLGDQVTLTAIPAPGWFFSAWSGDATGMVNPLILTITGNMVVTANYSTYSLWLPVIMR